MWYTTTPSGKESPVGFPPDVRTGYEFTSIVQMKTYPPIPPVIRKVLSVRNLHEESEIHHFLSPKLERLPHPLRMKGLEQAVSQVLEEMERQTEILIWGDYDVDGTTGTALLVNFFREIGVEPHWHIPNRLTDGYGLNSEKFKEIHKTRLCGRRFLLITVDCGISNATEIEEILALGGRAIVTDHHQLPTGDLPQCVIVNPNQPDCGFADTKLAGVGVAFYFASALRSALAKKDHFKGASKPNMKEFLGFVALGTIADLVEMTPTNRILVRAGMEILTSSGIAGLRALLESAGMKGHALTTEDVSFVLAPQINAAGRLGWAEVAVELMTCDNELSGMKLSRKLKGYNEQRKALCENNLEIALSIINNVQPEGNNTIIVVGAFHFGIIGIVASKLVELYGKPAIVFAVPDNGEEHLPLKGSGRSIPGVDLLQCLHACADKIMKYGGHSMAAGLTVQQKDFADFQRCFENGVALQRLNMRHSSDQEKILIECDVDEIMSRDALEYLQLLEPFGPGNDRPVFVDPAASIVASRTIGNSGQHLSLTLRGKYDNHRAVGFGLGRKRAEIQQTPTRRLTFTPMVNRFKGAIDWQIRVVDI